MVLFDWNGTLVDDVDRACQALDAVLGRRGLQGIGLDRFRQTFRLPLRDWLSTLGLETHDLAGAEGEWNDQMRSRPAALQRGARDLLTRLASQGREIGVVSAASTDAVSADLADTGLDRLIDVVVGDSADKVVSLAEVTNGRAHRGVYVGDVEYDIVAGRDAGLLTIAFTGGYRPKAALQNARPDALVDDLDEIAALLGID